MKIGKKVVLGLSLFVCMLATLVAGVVLYGKPSKSSNPTPNTETKVEKPTTYTFQPGEVEVVKGGNSRINFEYTPHTTADDEEEEIVVPANSKAYEYIFASTMDEAMALTLQPIVANGVTISYIISDDEVKFDTTTTAKIKYKTPKLLEKNVDVYVYIVISPENENTPVTFTTDVMFDFGKAVDMTYMVNGKEETATLVSGQTISQAFLDELVDVDGLGTDYYFDKWYYDETLTQPVTGEVTTYDETLYARFANLPASCMTFSDGEWSVTSGKSGDVIIPSVFDDGTNKGYVTSIADNAFNGKHVDLMDLPYTLETVGKNSMPFGTIDFSKCIKLKSIGHVFNDYMDYEDVDYPGIINGLSNCISLENIGGFQFCKMGDLDLNKCNFTNFDTEIFNETNINSLKLPSTLTTLRYWDLDISFADNINGFLDWSNLTNLTDLTIYEAWFAKLDLSACVNLERISGNMIGFDSINLTNCTKLKTASFMWGELTELDLTNCTQLTSFSVGNCDLLTEIDLSYCTLLTTIKSTTFAGCSSLATIKLPNSITTIEAGAFADTAITSLDLSACTGYTYVQTYTFFDLSTLTSVKLPNSVTIIEEYAFQSCDNLVVDSFPSSLQGIYSQAFMNIKSIEAPFPASLVEIWNEAFSGASAETLDFSKCSNLESIGDNAFYNMGVSNIVGMNNCRKLKKIGNDIFGSSTCKFVVPANLIQIGCGNMDNIYGFQVETTWYYTGSYEEWNTFDTVNAQLVTDFSDPELYAMYLFRVG